MRQHRNGFHIERGMRQGYETESPIPTKLVSNEEFQPQPQTPAQAKWSSVFWRAPTRWRRA